MTTEDRLTRFRQLQDALDRGHEVDSYLGQLQPHRGVVDPDRAAQIQEAYTTWYTATSALLPEDLRPRFVAAYEGDSLKPRLRFYLAHATDERPEPPIKPAHWADRWVHSYAFRFQSVMREQLEIVTEARQRSMASPSVIPTELKALIARPFSGRRHSIAEIDGLFEGAGAERIWRLKLPQRGYTGGQKVNRVWCWLDGIRMHAPEQEAAIVTKVCRALMDRNWVGAGVGKQMDALLVPAPPEAPPSIVRGDYIDLHRLAELRQLAPPAYDLTKLIQLCEELNACMVAGHYLAVAMLTRAILDHVPPVFGVTKLSEVTSNYAGSKSFKDSMGILNGSMRKIGDAHLHTQIRPSEVLPTRRQVDVGPDLDVLLAEIVRILKRP